MSNQPGTPGTEGAVAGDALPVVPPPPLQGDGVIHEIQWSDALPWWLLFRAAGAAFSPTVIILAALGSLATWAGWTVADRLGIADGSEIGTILETLEAAPAALGTDAGSGPRGLALVRAWLPAPAAAIERLVSVPFNPAATLGQCAGALARLAWFVAVWSIFGTGIARQVALKLAAEETPGLAGSLIFGSRSWFSAFNAVFFVLLGIVVIGVPAALLGVLMRTDVGLALAGILWPLLLALGIVLAILAIGVVAGWPLMVGCVGVERGDSFQAISTAFSYLYQRPLHTIFYALVALAVAVPALAAAHLFATVTSTLTLWAASLGMGHARTAEVLEGLRTVADGGAASFGVSAVGFWTRCLEAVLGSFGWGYFWAIATGAYLLLRRDVDGTELDEVVLDEIPGETP